MSFQDKNHVKEKTVLNAVQSEKFTKNFPEILEANENTTAILIVIFLSRNISSSLS